MNKILEINIKYYFYYAAVESESKLNDYLKEIYSDAVINVTSVYNFEDNDLEVIIEVEGERKTCSDSGYEFDIISDDIQNYYKRSYHLYLEEFRSRAKDE